MTDMTTARLSLPLLQPGQAQKEMSHNEALTLIDLGVQAAAQGMADTPPADPAPGACWIVGTAPTGAWAGHAGAVAGWTAGGWRFVAAREGMRLWIDTERGFALHRSGEWRFGEAHGKVFVEGIQTVGKRLSAIMEPNGGEVVDGPARAAIVAVLEAMRDHGLIERVV